MNRNVVYPVIGVLAAVALLLAYQLYQERQRTTGIEVNVGGRGISVEQG